MKDKVKNMNSPKTVPEELLAPSLQFADAMQSVDMHWWFWDVVKKKLSMSPALIEILGYDKDEFDPYVPTIDKNIHPDDVAENIEKIRNALSGDSVMYEMEYRVKVKGEWCWFYNRGSVVRDKDGNPLNIGGVAMDMSGRFGRMTSRLEEGKKFEFVFKHTMEPVFILDYTEKDKPGILVDMNEAAAKLFVINTEDIVGEEIAGTIDRIIQTEKPHLIEELSKKGHVRFETKYVDRFNEEKFLEVNAHSFTFTGKDMIVAIVNDMSESHQVKKSLKTSENLYRQLIQSADDRIGLFDTDGKAVILNSAYCRTLGYSPEEFLGINELERFHPEDVDRVHMHMNKFFDTGFAEIEYRIQHRSGHYLHMSAKIMLLKGEDGGLDYILNIIRDITAQKKFQKELVDAKDRAEESDLLKSAFLANMSHEIRTPMNSIVGFSSLLVDSDTDEETRQEYVKRINKNSDQLLTLISDIIDLSKIESNQMTVSFSNILLSTLFNDVLNYGEFQISSRSKDGVGLVFDPDPDHSDLSMQSDLIRITQVLQNLLNNAIKFTKEGNVTAGYRLMDGDVVQLFVKDTGVGIDEQNFEIIFDQFRQIDGSHTRTYGGTGLGLAISRNLVRMLGGKIWVESVKGEGASFYMEFPIKGEFDLIHVVENTGRNSEKLKNELSVLIVDDDEDSLKLLFTLLSAEGIQVTTADSGYRALQILEREHVPDMVFLDLQMPVLNGSHTMKIIRELYPEVKVIAQSAHAIDGAKAEIISSGFDDYFEKPYRKDEILAVIAKQSK